MKMLPTIKAVMLFCILVLFSRTLYAQSNNVGIGTNTPNPSAILDMVSSVKGVLVPRMTTAQRTAIASPAAGLLVYDITTGSFWFYNQTAWKNLLTPNVLQDADGNTKVQVEKNPNEDIIRFDLGGTENLALRKNPTGIPRLELTHPLNNTFVGLNSGQATTTGTLNTAIGSAALLYNTSGRSNVAVGTQALFANTDRSNLVAVGDSALYNNGVGAGVSDDDAIQNTAVGSKALFANTFGSFNTALGFQAGKSTISGYKNTFLGNQAGSENFGDENTYVGNWAGRFNTSGARNVFVGHNAGISNTTGEGNIGIGDGAGYGVVAGSNNVFIGRTAGYGETGSNKLYIENNQYLSTNPPLIYGEFDNHIVGINGKLGVGTNTPGAILEVSNGTVGLGVFPGFLDATPDNAWVTLDIPYIGNLRVWDNFSVSGNVGIGVSTIPAGIKLQVAGNIGTPNGTSIFVGGVTSDGVDGLRMHHINGTSFIDSKGAGGLFFRTDNVNGGSIRMTIKSDGNVGIGTLTPANKLDVAGGVAIGATYSGNAAPVNGAIIEGNVGIGTATPSATLDVRSATPSIVVGTAGGIDGALYFGNTNHGIKRNYNNGNDVGLFTTDGDIYLQSVGPSGTFMVLQNNGNVGIGRFAYTNNLEVEGTASKSVAGSWVGNSDARLKKNITPLNSRETLDKLLALQGITYEWNDDKTGSKRPTGIQYGFTAQNIQTVFPTLVEEDKLGYLQTAYGTYDAMTVEAIRALNSKIEEQTAEINRLKKVEAQLDKITAALKTAGIVVEK